MPSLQPLSEGAASLAPLAEGQESLAALSEGTETLTTLGEQAYSATGPALYPSAATFPSAGTFPAVAGATRTPGPHNAYLAEGALTLTPLLEG